MSFILDALKKAEQERRSGRQPAPTSASRPRPFAQRPRWVWVMAAALVVNAAVLIAVMRSDRIGGPPAPFRPASSAAREPVAGTHQPEGGVAADATANPPATAKPAQSRPTPVATGPADPKPARPMAAATSAAAVSSVVPTATPAPAPTPSPGRAPSMAPAVSAAPAPTAMTPIAALPAGPPLPPPSAASAPSAPPSPPTATGSPALTIERRDPAPRVVTRVPPREASPPRANIPTEMPAVMREAVPRLRLDALVYSDLAPQRMVFINNERYVEGQTIEGKVLVETITEQGAVLSYQGQRFLLMVERARSIPIGGEPAEADR